MEQKLNKVLRYFLFFNYHPTTEEIYTFFPIKISKKGLKTILEAKKYTPPEYSKEEKSNIKYQISKRKLKNWRFKTYIKLLSIFPQIKLIGLSGSIAMMNAKIDDDIDLFIITSKNRLFTGRFLATILAVIMGLKRRKGQYKAPNKVCLNLFFDESNLVVPITKKTEFVAHEILQMKPIINKDKVYKRFLEANRWVLKLFPNAEKIFNFQFSISNQFKNLNLNKNFKLKIENFGDRVEQLLKNFQLKLINRHKTIEIVTDSQLWFHPVDFGKKMKS
jgi:hypothetical protein